MVGAFHKILRVCIIKYMREIYKDTYIQSLKIGERSRGEKYERQGGNKIEERG